MKSDDKTVNLEVAEVLRRLRNRTDMKAEDVGKLIGRSKQTISAWETGKASPDASLFLKLCEIYGVKDINKEFENIKKIAPAQKRAKANKKELVKLLSDFLVNSGYIEDGNDLTDEQLKAAIAIVDFIDTMFQ